MLLLGWRLTLDQRRKSSLNRSRDGHVMSAETPTSDHRPIASLIGIAPARPHCYCDLPLPEHDYANPSEKIVLKSRPSGQNLLRRGCAAGMIIRVHGRRQHEMAARQPADLFAQWLPLRF